MLVGLSEDKTPFDFDFIRSMVKVTSVPLKNVNILLLILRPVYHRAFIYLMLIVLLRARSLMV